MTAGSADIDRLPCFREFKPSRVRGWLAARGLRIEAFDQSRFDSDSANEQEVRNRLVPG
jgi:hypothetical protein